LLSAKKIPAGKRGQIEAKINTDHLSGPLFKKVTISSNDPDHPSMTLLIKGVVEPEIGVADSEVFFDTVPAGEEVLKQTILTVVPGKSIKLLSALSKNPAISAQLEAVPGSNGKKWRLIAAHKANAKPGAFTGQIVVKTDSRLTPELFIYVRGVTVAAKK
jgi:hypothetical protein